MTEVKQNQGAGCPRQRTETGCHRQIRQLQAVWQQEGHYGVTNILQAGQSFKHGGAHFLYMFSPNDPIPADVTHWCDPADVTCVTHQEIRERNKNQAFFTRLTHWRCGISDSFGPGCSNGSSFLLFLALPRLFSFSPTASSNARSRPSAPEGGFQLCIKMIQLGSHSWVERRSRGARVTSIWGTMPHETAASGHSVTR